MVRAVAAEARSTPDVSIDTSRVDAVRVDGDPATLERMVRNLAENATRHAATRVCFSLAEHDAAAILIIDDDGPGIPPGDRDRVFERFVRLDEARARSDGGAGLGLAVVRAAARSHGGEVRAHASPCGGARFEVRLPVAGVRA